MVKKDFLQLIVTGDEMWVHQYEPASKTSKHGVETHIHTITQYQDIQKVCLLLV